MCYIYTALTYCVLDSTRYLGTHFCGYRDAIKLRLYDKRHMNKYPDLAQLSLDQYHAKDMSGVHTAPKFVLPGSVCGEVPIALVAHSDIQCVVFVFRVAYVA